MTIKKLFASTMTLNEKSYFVAFKVDWLGHIYGPFFPNYKDLIITPSLNLGTQKSRFCRLHFYQTHCIQVTLTGTLEL